MRKVLWGFTLTFFAVFLLLIGYRLSNIKRAENLVELPTKVKVGVVEDEKSVRISCSEPAELRFRGGTLRMESGEIFEFTPYKSNPAKLKYAVIVDTVPILDEEEVAKVIKKWRNRGYEVEKKLVGRIIRKDKYAFDDRVYFLSIAEFEQKEKAQTFCDKLYKRGEKGWVLEELVRRAKGRIKVIKSDEIFVGSYKPPLKISSKGVIKVYDVPYGVGFAWEGREDRYYRGKVEVNLNKNGRVCVINEVELEEYLYGIIPSEISPQAPIEALKAQCIAARGEALAKIGKRHLADPYDFCALQHCQVYKGIKIESALTNQAVKETTGKILIDKFGIIDAVYCANCGGHTECNENVWSSRKNPALRGVPDFDPQEVGFKSPITEEEIEEWLTSNPKAYCNNPECIEGEKFRWEVTYPHEVLNQIINKWSKVGEVKDIVLRDRGVSGRLKSIKIIGADNIYTVYKELPIRKVFGNLPSAMFILKIDRDEKGTPIRFRFIGGGWGHGVGMCQAGAIGMAKIGKSHNEILTHYYRGSTIIKLY